MESKVCGACSLVAANGVARYLRVMTTSFARIAAGTAKSVNIRHVRNRLPYRQREMTDIEQNRGYNLFERDGGVSSNGRTADSGSVN